MSDLNATLKQRNNQSILRLLSQYGQLPQSQLMNLTGMSQRQLANVLRRLNQAGIVEYSTDGPLIGRGESDTIVRPTEKVYGETPDQAARQSSNIERDSERQGGEPCIAGTRVPVRAVHEAVELGDRSPEAVAEGFGVSLVDVYRALTYYHDHREEMKRIEDEREQAKQRSLNDGAKTLSDLRDSGESEQDGEDG